ncbi:MAG: ATP-dependent DNA helicase, partial [Candidatus Latescibacterota bacterium]
PEKEDVPVHWAQAKVYASILAIQHDLESVDVQLTYVQLESLACHEDRRTFEREELLAFFEDVITRYMHWAHIYHGWCDERDATIKALPFPFADY